MADLFESGPYALQPFSSVSAILHGRASRVWRTLVAFVAILRGSALAAEVRRLGEERDELLALEQVPQVCSCRPSGRPGSANLKVRGYDAREWRTPYIHRISNCAIQRNTETR